MKLLKLSWLRYYSLISRFCLFVFFLILIFLSENFIKKEYLFNKEIFSSRICYFLRNNYYKLEKVFLCSSSYKEFSHDWKSLKEKHVIIHERKIKEENSITEKKKKKGIKEGNNSLDLILDTNNPSLDESVLEKSKIVFKNLDKNNNNLIDFKEFIKNVKILSKSDEISENILNYLFELFDINKDKKLNYIEFLSLNSYDFNYIKLIKILFASENEIDKNAIFQYLNIYFSEFLENIIEDEMHIFIKKNNLVHLFSEYFFKNSKNIWDINEDKKLQLEEFHNFQLSLLLEIYHISNFIQLDYNLDGRIDIAELLLYISNDNIAYMKLNAYNKNNKKKEDLFKYLKESLKIDEFSIFNLELIFYSFDNNNDMLLDIEEFKNHTKTFSILDNKPEIIYAF